MNTFIQPPENIPLSIYIKRMFRIAERYYKTNVEKTSVRGLVVPHAGLMYSGVCAAAAYNSVRNQHIENVLLLCTDHNTNSPTCYIPKVNSFHTEMGDVYVNKKIINELRLSSLFIESDKIFQKEHSFFVQLPFISFCF